MPPPPEILPPRLEELWQEYLAAERHGLRDEAMGLLADFMRDLEAQDPHLINRWARDLARAVVDGQESVPMRGPLFERFVLPALLDGIANHTAECARLLAGLYQSVMTSRAGLAQLPGDLNTPRLLLERALADDPENLVAGRDLVDLLARDLAYAIHEVPSGVLWDANGASAEQCLLLEGELDRFRELQQTYAPASNFAELIDQCALHFRAYRGYLLSGAAAGRSTSYADYLDQIAEPQ